VATMHNPLRDIWQCLVILWLGNGWCANS
jgi:hypothetical protein